MIQNINSLPPPMNLPGAQSTGASTGGPSFKQALMDALDHVNSMQVEADEAVEQFAVGGEIDPAEVLTAVQKADLTFRMMMQIRNKLVQAYQEIKEIRI